MAESATRRLAELSNQIRPPDASLKDGSSAKYGDCSNDSMRNLADERAKASFVVRDMTHFLNGGSYYTECKEKVMMQLETIGTFNNVDAYDLTKAEARKRTMEHLRAVYRLFMSDHGDMDMRNARVEITNLYSPDWSTRNGVHFGLFVGAITGQGTQEQQDYWMPLALTLQIYGCFAMTELRGGSFLRGLETTATFIPGGGPERAGEFDIHSPTITATKWWIGGASETATHCAVYARLITKGEDHGVHVFIVQLRDTETHAVLPGVRVGDVGRKMGRNGLDNGWIQFHHVRVPHAHYLCRYAKVESDGTYVRSAAVKPQMAYGALIMGRASMVQDSASVLQMATTIAVRWAAARREGEPFRKEGSGASTPASTPPAEDDPESGTTESSLSAVSSTEPQILDYVTHQHKLMPLIATAFAFQFMAIRMKEMYDNLMAGMDSDDVSALPDVHATSSGLKAFCTWATHYGIDTCRQACGGHGYSSYSRFPSLFADFAVMCTWEGDNTVMALQTARYLINSLAKSKAKGATLSGSVRYLTDKIAPKCGVTSPDGLLDVNALLTAMRWRARTSVLTAAAQLDSCKKAGMNDAEAWNSTAPMLVDASRAHVFMNITAFFAVAVARRRISEELAFGKKYPGGVTKDPLTGRVVTEPSPVLVASATPRPTGGSAPQQKGFPARRRFNTRRNPATDGPQTEGDPISSPLYPVLKALLDLFALHTMEHDMAFYLRHGYLTPAQAGWIEKQVASLCARVRSDAVPLIDSFNLSDFIINSPMARKDGDVYRAYMDRVASLPGGQDSVPYFEELIKPMLEGQDLNSR